MAKLIFPDNFIWGTATASYQIEGGCRDDGKGESIWDRFTRVRENISDRNNGDIACDSYHLYRQDVELMKELGLDAYRFSISWSRVFPEGKGRPNPKGIDYYKRLTAALAENGIKPVVTLSHWDLPQKLQDIGGWANHDTTDYFMEYARYMYKELGDSVPIWITHNEPSVVTFIGNWLGTHAPGIKDFSTALLVSHNLLLSHGKAVKAYREMGLKGEIGITLATSNMYPATGTAEDAAAAIRSDGYWNRWFMDPVLKGKYPQDMLDWYAGRVVVPDITQEDLKLIGLPVDFLGVNYYYASSVSSDKNKYPLELTEDFIGQHRTEMGWGVNPESLGEFLLRLHKDYDGVKMYITENGAAYKDIINREGRIADDNRTDFLYRYLTQIHRAIQGGADISGYFVWTLMDNFEWAYGFSKRFGLAYTDHLTHKRTIKDSGYWYRDVIRNNAIETV